MKRINWEKPAYAEIHTRQRGTRRVPACDLCGHQIGIGHGFHWGPRRIKAIHEGCRRAYAKSPAAKPRKGKRA